MTAVHRTKWFLPGFAVALGAAFAVAQWIGGDPSGGLISLAIMTVFGLAIMNYRWAWATGAFVAMLCFVEIALEGDLAHELVRYRRRLGRMADLDHHPLQRP